MYLYLCRYFLHEVGSKTIINKDDETILEEWLTGTGPLSDKGLATPPEDSSSLLTPLV